MTTDGLDLLLVDVVDPPPRRTAPGGRAARTDRSPPMSGPRFVAKVKDTSARTKVYSVYDQEHASYPALVPGFGAVKQSGTEEEMTAEAQRLADYVAAGGAW